MPVPFTPHKQWLAGTRRKTAVVRLEHKFKLDHLQPASRFQELLQLPDIRTPPIRVDAFGQEPAIDQVKLLSSEPRRASICSKGCVQVPSLLFEFLCSHEGNGQRLSRTVSDGYTHEVRRSLPRRHRHLRRHHDCRDICRRLPPAEASISRSHIRGQPRTDYATLMYGPCNPRTLVRPEDHRSMLRCRIRNRELKARRRRAVGTGSAEPRQYGFRRPVERSCGARRIALPQPSGDVSAINSSKFLPGSVRPADGILLRRREYSRCCFEARTKRISSRRRCVYDHQVVEEPAPSWDISA